MHGQVSGGWFAYRRVRAFQSADARRTATRLVRQARGRLRRGSEPWSDPSFAVAADERRRERHGRICSHVHAGQRFELLMCRFAHGRQLG